MARSRRIGSSPLVPGLLAGAICLILGTGAFVAIGVGLVALVVFAAVASTNTDEPVEATRPVRRPAATRKPGVTHNPTATRTSTVTTSPRRPAAPVRPAAARSSRVAA